VFDDPVTVFGDDKPSQNRSARSSAAHC
jgi:hypothetical protein